MQLLQEEFFGKIWKFIKEIRVTPIRWVAKLIFYLIVFSIMGILIWLIYAKKYSTLGIFVGIIILGEVAHFIRKSREKAMNKTIETKNDMKDEEENPLNKKGLIIDKVFNKEGLLKN